MIRSPRALLVALASVVAVLGLVSPAQAATPVSTLTTFDDAADFRRGTLSTAVVSGDRLTMKAGTTSGVWESPWIFGSATNVIPSWNLASSNGGTSLNVWVRVRSGSKVSGWKHLATWRHALSGKKRTSYGKQSDALASVATDTVNAAKGVTFTGWQMKVELRRDAKTGAAPSVRALHLAAANVAKRSPATSKTTMTKTVDLAVPQHSQMIHRGHFPEYGGGGNAWCSPTTTSMLLRYWGKGPSASTYAWAKDTDGHVDYAARFMYDSGYRGAGNWSFAMAYASRYSTIAHAQRMVSLRDVEALIKEGVPVGASIAFAKGKLSGAPISSTAGHLVVIRGFTKSGDVIVNDPAAPKNSSVKRTYSRAQFEAAWLGGSGGLTYVVRPA